MTPHFPSTFTQWLAILDGIIFRQHREPLAFFDDLEGKDVSRFLWAARLLVIFAVIIFLRNVASFGDPAWVEPFMRTVGAGLMLLIIFFGLLIMVTQTWRLWLLYLFSPPWLLLLFFTGLADATTIGLGLPVMAALSFAFGVLLADAVALRFYKWAKSAQSERERQRIGGVAADLPTLAQWSRVRVIRFAITGLLIVATMATLFQGGDVFWGVASLFAVAGCTHFDATVFACFKWPLVKALTPSPSPNACPERSRRVGRGGQWRATYIGRHALLVPQTSVAQAITPNPSAANASAALVALLREGCLGPQVRKTCANMLPEHLSPLLLHLSLQEGGAEAMRYLEPALPQVLRHVATCYAKLASEAAKPPDLQRWIGLLPPKPVDPVTTALDGNVSLTLAEVREALLQYEYTPTVDLAYLNFRNMVQELYDDADTTTTLPLSWPVALLKHLEQHRERL